MKKKILNVLSIILIIALIGGGVSLLFYAGYAKYVTNQKQNDMKEVFKEELKKENNNKTEKPKDDKEVKEDDDRPATIALMNIPKIDVEVAVAEGIQDNVLKYAVGHFPETANAGQVGNFAVAGHRNFTYAEYFKDLDKLKNGDKIIVTTLNGTYTYIVSESIIVRPDQTEVLDKTKDATITLVTCTEGAKDRLIIKGKLKK